MQPTSNPGEPTAFGTDPAALWDLLRSARGWWCVNVPPSLAAPLAELMRRELRTNVRLYGDVYHTPAGLIPSAEAPAVRLLTPGDLPLLEAAPDAIRGTGSWGDARSLLSEGFAAGAVISGRLVAVALTSALTGRHADVGVATLDGWRGRGLATAAASLVARRVQETGRVPVWSAGEDNHASLRVAQKLNFEERFRRVYVIPTRLQYPGEDPES